MLIKELALLFQRCLRLRINCIGIFDFVFVVVNLARLLALSLIFLPFYFVNKNRAIYLFLKLSGPSFIKLGQVLSSRPDLVGESLALVLAEFQDQLKPFSAKKVKKILAAEYQDNFSKIFADFDYNAVASASIAQVHKARLVDGKVVAVKILRPKIAKIMARDIATLKVLVLFVAVFSRFLFKSFSDIADLLKEVSKSELDLQQEAANASLLKENLRGVKGFYVPQVYFDISCKKVLVLEWIEGIPFSDKKAILNSAFDKKEVARSLVISYFTQVYSNGFFHADMHPGNLFLMASGDIAVVDFGIMGRIDKKTRLAVAEILIGFLHKDYKKVAKIHVEAGFVPKDTNVDALAISCRKIGESIVGNSVKDVSLAQLLANLITMTRDYKMVTRPELLLLQKTLLLVEGVGVMLDPELNMWELARPWVQEWAKKNIGFDAKMRDALLDLFDLAKRYLRSI